MQLSEFLIAGGRLPFVWGAADCCLWPADWIMARLGIDPARPLRGRYGTAYGAYRHIARLGGFETMVRNLMSSAGLRETDDPKEGDVGLIITDQGFSIGIKTGTGWAAKAPRGITVARFQHVAAWAV